MPRRTYPSARERILDAAEETLVAEGPRAVTVEAVAARAGVSKGGFFYHFASKDELLRGLTERIVSAHLAQIEALASSDPEERGRMLRSFLRFALDIDRTERFRRLMSGFLVLAGESPGTQALVQDLNQQLEERARVDGIPFAQYVLVHLAMDGYWMGSALGTRNMTAEQSEALERLLFKLSSEPLV